MTASGIYGSKIYIKNKQESNLSYSVDNSSVHVDSLISVVNEFMALFDADVDSGEAYCIGDSEDILDVMEYANRVLGEIEMEAED